MGRRLIVAAIVTLACLTAGAANMALTDRNGRITSMDLNGEVMAIHADVRIPLAGWGKFGMQGQAQDVQASQQAGTRQWAGRIETASGKWYRYEETLKEADGAVDASWKITADTDVKTEGVFLWLTVPVPVFAGGKCELLLPDAGSRSAEMPRERQASRHFLSGSAGQIALLGARGNRRLDIIFGKPCHVSMQDNREWNDPTYSALIRFPCEQLAKGQSVSLKARIRLSGKIDRSPATLALDASRVRYKIDGFGGNYCFNIESPVTDYTLDNLRVAWARTEMTPGEWEPRNDNASPEQTDWEFLKSHDKPGTNLHREFLLAQKIQRKGIPYAMAIWHLPEWLYAEPGKGPQGHGRWVHADKWPELLECLGSYLLYAKRQYGVEPDLFQFNEPDWGVRVKLTPEEHRDAAKRIGAHFAKLGLKTMILLGDVTNPRGTHTYILPTLADAGAMRYVGAIGFHSWGGASPRQYGAWADLAEKHKLPLLVSELGADAGAWRGRAYRSFHYALTEVEAYQQLLLYARPQGTMQWEFTADYGIVDEVKEGGRSKLVPTFRFWFVKHFCNLTPPKASALTTRSDHPKVLFTAFTAERNGGRVYTLHVFNHGPGRSVTITGIPPAVAKLRAVRTGESEWYRELPAIRVENGVVKTDLARQSLLTLTTMAAE